MINKKRFSKGTLQGKKLIEHSLQELGCGRSVLADKDGVIIAGNDVYDAAVRLGKKVVTVETDGDVLIVVKRTDVSADEKKGLELALVDNLSQERNLDWDAHALTCAMNECLAFDPRKWGGYECITKELNLPDFFKNKIVIEDKKKKDKCDYIPSTLSLFDSAL